MKIKLYIIAEGWDWDFRTRRWGGILLFYYYPVRNKFVAGGASKSNRRRLNKW